VRISELFHTWWKPNNAYLVFVATSPGQCKSACYTAFLVGERNGPKPTYASPQPPAKTSFHVDRPASVQSIINFATPVELKPGTPDVIPSSVMNNILGGGFSGRLFANCGRRRLYLWPYSVST
jgi:predicted Zn-dependent peptidase